MRVVLCNCPPERSEELARGVVSEGLAACVNVVPGVVSFYVWKGKLERDAESTLLIKVAAEGVPALAAWLRAHHPYELPEIVALEVDLERSSEEYVRWVRENTGREGT